LINDYIIRKFAGGSHDGTGMAWCTVMFGLTILISFVIMLIEMFKANKVGTVSKKEVTINFSVLIIGLLLTVIYYLNIINYSIKKRIYDIRRVVFKSSKTTRNYYEKA
jgi:hypothetical protein